MEAQLFLTPSPLDSPICILGPYQTNDNGDGDGSLLELAMEYAPIFSNPNITFSRLPAYRTWPWTIESDNHQEWRRWSYRVEAAHGAAWKDRYIFDLINFCRHGIALDSNLLAAAICFWSRSTNTFFFSGGPMAPTVLDISAITGLPLFGDGNGVTPAIAYSETANFKVSRSKDKTYGVFISTYMGRDNTPVSREEHIRFIALWLCRYIFYSRSVQVTHEYFNLAIAIVDGTILNLSTAILTFLYRSLFELVSDPTSSPFGPLWILQVWIYLYFPHLRPPGHRLDDLPEAPLCCRLATASIECFVFKTYL